MTYPNLDAFLVRLEQAGELIHITQPVKPDQITAMTAAADKALWFEQVSMGRFPIVTNLYGGERRMAWALGVDDLSEIEERVQRLLHIDFPPRMGQLMGRLGELTAMLRSSAAQTVPNAPAQAIHLPPDLTQFAIPHGWPVENHPALPALNEATVIQQRGDGGRRITLSRVIVLDAETIAIPTAHIDPTAPIQAAVAVILGGDPVMAWAAGVPLPDEIDPYWLAGWLRSRPITMTGAVTQPISIPAEAEIIIEGHLLPDAPGCYGGFAGVDGFYTPPAPFARIRVTAITCRQNAVLPLHIIRPPPSEHTWQQHARSRLLMPFLRLLMSEVVDLYLPPEGVFRNLVVVSVRCLRVGQAQKVICGLWGMGEMAYNKTVILVDADVNPHDLREVFRQVFAHVDWANDLTLIRGALHPDDQTAIAPGFGGKLGIDATSKPDTPTRPPRQDRPSQASTGEVGGMPYRWRIWHEAVIIVAVAAPAGGLNAPQPLFDALWAQHPAYHIALVDAEVDIDDPSVVIRYSLASADWWRDFIIKDGLFGLNATRRGRWTPALEEQQER